jgi:hypothetical protein
MKEYLQFASGITFGTFATVGTAVICHLAIFLIFWKNLRLRTKPNNEKYWGPYNIFFVCAILVNITAYCLVFIRSPDYIWINKWLTLIAIVDTSFYLAIGVPAIIDTIVLLMRNYANVKGSDRSVAYTLISSNIVATTIAIAFLSQYTSFVGTGLGTYRGPEAIEYSPYAIYLKQDITNTSIWLEAIIYSVFGFFTAVPFILNRTNLDLVIDFVKQIIKGENVKSAAQNAGKGRRSALVIDPKRAKYASASPNSASPTTPVQKDARSKSAVQLPSGSRH